VNLLATHLHLVSLPSITPWAYYSEASAPTPPPAPPGVAHAPAAVEMPALLPWLYYPVLALLTVFLFGLWHRDAFRRRVAAASWEALGPLHKLFVGVPMSLLRMPALGLLVSSWAFQLCYWYLFKPLVVVLLLWPLLPERWTSVYSLGGTFLVVLV